MQKVIVFDLGGTLMEYKGMPLNWCDYYYKGFGKVKDTHGLELSEIELQEAVERVETIKKSLEEIVSVNKKG